LWHPIPLLPNAKGTSLLRPSETLQAEGSNPAKSRLRVVFSSDYVTMNTRRFQPERMNFMNLQTPSPENLAFLVNEIKNGLKVVNTAIFSPEDFSLDVYEDLLDLYEMIRKKEGRLTMMEIEGVLEELRELRKAKPE
jgi:uncharacterized protein YfkK (UPF0435 family)